MDIDFNLDCLHTCHDKTVEKIENIGNFWKRFNLSLPGRINIAKTLMLSQISYLGCFISPHAQQLERMTSCIEGFIKKNVNVAKTRIYEPTNRGGLGMIDISIFLKAQQAVWFKRAFKANIDNWRYDITMLFYGNCLIARSNYIDITRHPILSGITDSFAAFCREFYKKDDNYKSSFILNNPIIFRERGSTGILDKNFFNQNPPIDLKKLCKIKFSDCFSNGTAIHLDVINTNFELNMNLATYMRLIGALSNFYRSLKNNRITDGTFISLQTFFSSPARGSKTLRNVLNYESISKIKIETKKTVQTFFGLINCPLLEKQALIHTWGSWNNVCLTNSYREFLFKFFNNYLGLNTRLSHFVQNFSRSCTFCSIRNIITDETFKHLFFECNTTRSLQQQFEAEFLENMLQDNNSRLIFWFTGTVNNGIFNTFLHHCALIFQHTIWEFKLKKKIPSYHSFKCNFFTKLGNTLDTFNSLMFDANNFDLALCRNVRALVRRHRDGAS